MAQSEVVIPEKIFFKIGEVCDILDVQAHVLRYWETEFPMLSPQKNRSGQRTYRRRDVEMALRIKDLLYDDLYTIAGAKKRLQLEQKEGIKPKKTGINHDSGVDSENSPGSASERELDDEVLEIEDLDFGDDNGEQLVRSSEPELTGDRREALKSLASQLLELREMLKSDQTRKAEEHLNRR